MDGDKHGRQTLGMALEMVSNEVIYNDVVCAMPHCDNIADVAFKLGYNATWFGPHDLEAHETRWIPFCDGCQDDQDCAPHWWNKALRGESLDDEEE